MKALGVDPSSSEVGLAVVQDGGELLHHEQWHTGLADTRNPRLVAIAMLNLKMRIDSMIMKFFIDKVVIEQLANAQSLNTVRAIMYFEATSMLATLEASNNLNEDIELVKVVATSMRKEVFGKGNLTKDQCADIVRKHLGKTETALPTPRSRIERPVFTDDETDAYAYGCYGVGFKLHDPSLP